MGADRADYLDGGLRPLACPTCATVVRVKKHSQAHTSIQWSTPTTACPALAGDPGAPGCPALRQAIQDAVRRGALAVGDG
ncbi:hypothetical protein JOF53_006958 [Crossiella equi]|uniref:Ferredoxin n=1 Tax=Crossiella equi TaxID=130796 RepID=A0ABS5ANU0_9PSEU|nr:hypothetical protein [Crossiella equi]MBP2478086.1 hypothetical protein [Crossiella equi]